MHCFAVPAAGQLGNLPLNSLVGPGAWQVNFNPFKEFPLNFIREGGRIQLGANIVNIFNHPVFNNPRTSLTDSNLGRILGANDPRIMQFALKYIF